jgi:uncharacterized protein YcgI (DUF1989 family)
MVAWYGQKTAKPSDFIDLRAEMNVLVVMSNCPHPLDPSPLTILSRFSDRLEFACTRR